MPTCAHVCPRMPLHATGCTVVITRAHARPRMDMHGRACPRVGCACARVPPCARACPRMQRHDVARCRTMRHDAAKCHILCGIMLACVNICIFVLENVQTCTSNCEDGVARCAAVCPEACPSRGTVVVDSSDMINSRSTVIFSHSPVAGWDCDSPPSNMSV
jgi:hypothetical protein